MVGFVVVSVVISVCKGLRGGHQLFDHRISGGHHPNTYTTMTLTMTQTIKEKYEALKGKVTPERLEVALRIYCRYHLKPGDLEAVPELRKYITNN
jgi:hypothetical protein